MPYIFVYVPNSFTAKISANETFTVWFPGTTPFAKSTCGKIITFIICFFRDVFVVLVQVVLNLILIYLLKNYLAKKAKTSSTKYTPMHSIGNTVIETTANNQNKKISNRISKAELNMCFMSFV